MSRFDRYENARNVYKLLKEKGDIDKIKSQIRTKLILGFATFDCSMTKFDETNDPSIKMTNCLIANHMRIHGYNYSLSVFLPEIGLNDFETDEHVKAITFSKFNKRLNFPQRQGGLHGKFYSLLVSIIKAFEDFSGLSTEQKAVQTIGNDDHHLYQKLNDINKEYEAVRSSEILHAKKLLDDRLEQYKGEIYEQSRIRMEQQMLEFRQSELTSIKLQMEEEYQKRLYQHEQQLEQDFEYRCQSLNEKEKLILEKYNLSEQKEERELFIRRQALQVELDAIQMMKAQLDQEKVQIDKDRIQVQKDHEKNELELKKRENLLEIKERTLESEIHKHVNQIRMEDEIKLVKQRKELELQSVQLSENQKMFEEKLKIFESLKQDLLEKQNKFTEMEIVGYDTIKTQNEVLKVEISNLQKQLKNVIMELEEQKQIAASATTELAVLKVVKQETEKLINTLNNDHAVFIQEKYKLQKKLNEQQNEIHELTERLALYENKNKSYCVQTNEDSLVNYSTRKNQSLNKPHMLTEADRRSIYEECNLSISSDLSSSCMIDIKKADKSCSVPVELSTDSNTDHWRKRFELSRRRMAQLRMVSEEFDSIYEEWKSLDLKEFLSKIHNDLPNFLNKHKLEKPINLRKADLSDHIIMINNKNESDSAKNHQNIALKVEVTSCEDECKASLDKAKSESRNTKLEFEESNRNIQLHSSASSLREVPANSSDADTSKSNRSALKQLSTEILSMHSNKCIQSPSNAALRSLNKASNGHLSSNGSGSVNSRESLMEEEPSQSVHLRAIPANLSISEISNHSVSCQFNRNDDSRSKSIGIEQIINKEDDNKTFVHSNQNNIDDGIMNSGNYNDSFNKKNHTNIENCFPLLLETSRQEFEDENKSASELSPSKECLNGYNDKKKSISDVNISPTLRHTTMKQTNCNDIMEKYLKLSLNANSNSSLPITNNQQINGFEMTNTYHSPNSKEKPLWLMNNHHFNSNDESDSISSINNQTKCQFSLEKCNQNELLSNDVDIDSGSDYIW
ncbi:Oral-facial-digital syndrome 1 protein [Schistosoma japonicum]|nr:Oral-facial-digital syndrome 1 protein [Schistosoma japonicum]